jgi:hypothetical protein
VSREPNTPYASVGGGSHFVSSRKLLPLARSLPSKCREYLGLLSHIYTQPSRTKHMESLGLDGTGQQDEVLGVRRARRLKHRKFVNLVGSRGSLGGSQCIVQGPSMESNPHRCEPPIDNHRRYHRKVEEDHLHTRRDTNKT